MAEGKKVPETRLLLIGKTGSGKSSTGNSILGEKLFQTSLSFASTTTTSSYEERIRHGRRFVVVDTPGFYDTVKSNAAIVREISKVFGYLSSGFHAMLYVLNTERFTEESVKAKKLFLRTFGDDVKRYTIIVLTNYDRVRDEGITDVVEYLKQSGPEFTTFYKACNKRLVTFNNKANGPEMDGQVAALIDMVDKVNRDNYGNVYTNFHLRLVHAFTKMERRRRRDLRKTREVLFSRAVSHLGMERMVTWDKEQDRPVRVKAVQEQSALQKATVLPSRSQQKHTQKIKAISVKIGCVPDISVTNINDKKHKVENINKDEHTTDNLKSKVTNERGQGSNTECRSDKLEKGSGEDVHKADGSDHYETPRIEAASNHLHDDLILEDLDMEDGQDTSNWHDEHEGGVVEERKVVKDEHFVTRLVDFFCVFLERLVK